MVTRFDEIVSGLRPDEAAALKILEANGWQIALDVRIEDMYKPDGSRRRTFSNRGRYAVTALLKNLSSREAPECLAFPAVMSKAEPVVAPTPAPDPVAWKMPEPVAKQPDLSGPGRQPMKYKKRHR